MSLKSIIATPLFLVLASTAGAAEQTRQTTVVQDMATESSAGKPQGPVPVPYPTTGAAGPQGTGHAGGVLVGLGDGSVRQGVRDGTSNTLMVGEQVPGAATPQAPGGPQNYGSVPPGGAGPATPGAKKVKTPSGGTKLPAVQKAREAANRSPQADKHKGHIEIESFSLGAVDNAAGRGTHHNGGVVVLGDGSVRNGVSPVGGNETISIGSGSTETTKGAGANQLKLDDAAGGAKAPRLGGLGSLQGMGSIGQLAAPPGGDQAAGREVRQRMFSIVDRTQMSKEGSGTGAVGGNKTQNIGIGRTETTAGGGPHVKAFSGNHGAGGRAPGNITPKGQAIKQN
jgi:hypothetical protein